MRDTPMSIMAIFAHPDDEVGTGSTLSHYAEQGVVINLVCASRGEAATIYCDDCATRENLAEVRTRELECACRNLGVAELRWLDWPDGGIKDLPRPRSIGQVVRLIREFRPDVIITHPENGLYPHPDHLAVWEITRAAFDAAGDPEQFPGSQPWSPARLYTRAIPQSFFDAAPAFASYRVELKGEQLPFYATPDDAIDVVMEVACCVEHREAARECHRSQHNPDG
ncbi:MAG TPA: PIG-L family deacetylase, partial [Anaerolineae bacterium]